jgi:hypothetical protein
MSIKSQQSLQSDKKIALRANFNKKAAKILRNSSKTITFLLLDGSSKFFLSKSVQHMFDAFNGNLPTRTIGTCGEKCRISGFHFDTTFSKDALDAIE